MNRIKRTCSSLAVTAAASVSVLSLQVPSAHACGGTSSQGTRPADESSQPTPAGTAYYAGDTSDGYAGISGSSGFVEVSNGANGAQANGVGYGPAGTAGGELHADGTYCAG